MEAKCTQPPSSATRIRRTTSTNGSGAGNGPIILGKYQLGRFLGRGSFAKVYHGLCLDDNTNIAIKVIDKKSIIGTDVSMEPRIILSALHYCHQNGVTHRDIKPQNILLDQNNNLKISDFGLSALPEQLKNDLLHTACGTPGYTAPEVAYRKGYNGEKVDSWSCGVILFAFLSGYLPFDSGNLSNMYRAIHRRDFRFPNWVSKSARSVINKLLDPNPSTRLSIEQLMKLSWFKKSNQQQKSSECVFEKNRTNLGGINAFDIISMSSGLNLSRLFESDLSKREMKFTTNARIEEVEEKVMKIGEEGGFRVERGKGRGFELVKGRVVLMVEFLEVAMELLLVEVKVVNNGGLEFDDSQWEDLKFGMKDICSFMDS
ncbi:hypothetical protein KY289_015932 [Solanum tuberosum]|nr:hypothetical protein KY289_015932 [Solanum tuberosum]